MRLSAAIALVVLSLFAPPARFLVYLRLALITALVLVATGCAPAPAALVKPREVEVTTYVREPIPAELTQDRNFAEQTPQCTRDGKPVLCNGQQSIELNDCRAVVDQHNADKAALRQLDTNTPPTTKPAAGAGEPAPAPAGGKPSAQLQTVSGSSHRLVSRICGAAALQAGVGNTACPDSFGGDRVGS